MKEVFQKQRRQDRVVNKEASRQPLGAIVRDIRDPIIGYGDLFEYRPPNERDPYLYKCKLCRVINHFCVYFQLHSGIHNIKGAFYFQNDIYRSADMADHLLTTVHQRRYFEVRYSNVPETRDELVQEVQNEFDNVQETADIIPSTRDAREYRDALRNVRSYEGVRKATKRRLSPKRSGSPEPVAEGGFDIDIPELPPHLRPTHDQPQVDLSLVDTSEIPSFSRQQSDRGDSKAGLSLSDTLENNTTQSSTSLITQQEVPPPPHKTTKTELDPVTVFHREVAKYVKQSLDKYYFPPEVGQPNERRIADGAEYGTLAKGFSHQFRREEKDSYVAQGNDLDTIIMTADIKSRIKDRIDMEMEKKPILN